MTQEKTVASKLFFEAGGNNWNICHVIKNSLLKWQETKNLLGSPVIAQILNLIIMILRVEISEELIIKLPFIPCPWAICAVIAGICAGKHAYFLEWGSLNNDFSWIQPKDCINNLSQLWCIKYMVVLCGVFFTVSTCL